MIKKLISLLLPLAALCSCTPPPLETSGDISVHMTSVPGRRDYTYPRDAASEQQLADWLEQHEGRRCSHCFMQYVPYLTVNFPNATVYFYHDSVHISPLSMRQYIRDLTPEDAAFCEYLISLAPESP